MTDNNTDRVAAFALGMQTMRVLTAILDGLRTRHNLVAQGMADGQIETTDYNKGYLEGLLHVGLDLENTIKEMLNNGTEESTTTADESGTTASESGSVGEQDSGRDGDRGTAEPVLADQ